MHQFQEGVMVNPGYQDDYEAQHKSTYGGRNVLEGKPKISGVINGD